MIKEKSCGIVLFKRNHAVNFLLLHYKSGHWDFSKGHVEAGENEKDTAARELAEETGVKDIKLVEGFREQISYFFRREKETVSKEVVFYLAETKSDKVKISFEHIGYKWLNYEDSLKQLTFKNSQEVLKRAMEFLTSSTS
jgi:8-oxo-dGTP pyrophosphatase MutT (NUDIX family)